MYLHFSVTSNVNTWTVVSFKGFKDNINYSWFLVNDQCDTQISFYVFIFIYNSPHITSMLGFYSQPAHDTATNTEWQLPEVVLIQFVSPDDEHDVLEICREL
jgi:hypothetical protein